MKMKKNHFEKLELFKSKFCNLHFALCSLLLLSVLLFGACNKTKAQVYSDYEESDWNAGNRELMDADDAFDEYATDEAIKKAFTLDYTPELPEPLDSSDTLSASELSGGATLGGNGVQIIPGLRKLSDYKTVYYDEAQRKIKVEKILAAQRKAEDTAFDVEQKKSALTIEDWGPKNFLSSAVRRPSIFVVFSQPMIAISSLQEQKNTSPFVTITPSVKGVFRWYGTSFLSFEAEEPLQSQQTYKINVNPDAKSIYGNTLRGERQFTFETERLSMLSIDPGVEYRKKAGFSYGNDDVPPQAARSIAIAFNYPVKASDIKDSIQIETKAAKLSWSTLKFSLSQIDDFKVLAEVQGKIDFESKVLVTLKEGAKSGYGNLGTDKEQRLTFSTPDAFTITSCRQETAWGEYRTMIRVSFSHSLDENSITGLISTDPEMEIKKDTVKVWDNDVLITNLPLKYGDKFTLKIGGAVKDIYGRTLGSNFSKEITMPKEPDPVGEVNFLDRGNVMLEAQFAPRMLFEYKNIVPQAVKTSWYTLESKDNPFSTVNKKSSGQITLKDPIKNYRYFEEIDLSPYLNSKGKGFVSFNAELTLLNRITSWNNDPHYTATNKLNIQVTDLGITVRHAFNKTVVLVTSLQTGKPIENANVRLIYRNKIDNSLNPSVDETEYFASGITDKDGLAIIETSAGLVRNSENDSFQDTYVYAEKDGDRAVFFPNSHNTYRYDIWARPPVTAEKIEPVTFMFSDRGLYKPGETLTFRGVDKTLILGNYAVYNGDYEIRLRSEYWDSEPIVTLNGKTSESGGFHGEIKIPADATPGPFGLVYSRVNDTSRRSFSAHTPITIAFFERLKFAASISKPQEAVIMGKPINLTLSASYLAGGSLAGASYHGSWERQLTYFNPQTKGTKDFSFGIHNAYDSRNWIGNTDGTLGAAGTAGLSQDTTIGRGVVGGTYLYKNETTVTDVSNQIVSAAQSVRVHPALFYIGIRQPSRNGFPKAGIEQTYEYITVDTEGELLNDTKLFASGAPLNVELVRHDWKRVQQRGVNGYIYDRYEEVLENDTTQKLVLKSSGEIKIKPSSAGYYTLRVTSSDKEARKVITESSFYVTGSSWSYWNMSDSQSIRLTPDSNEYNPGDKAQILLQSALPKGYYLITVEREGIFTQTVQYFEEAATVFEVPIARNYVPVIYVSIASYSVRNGEPTHTYGGEDLDKPKGYYGVTKLFVNSRVRAFSVKVETDKKVFRPGDEVSMTLTASRGGKPLANAELTLMAVDRGVLDLINYHVPDPISYFYNQERFNLKVRGGDSRALLMDPVTYSIKNLIGGDSDSKIEMREDFNPLAVFEPYLLTDSTGKVTYKFKLPDTLTTYRVTVFGVSGDLFSLKESEIAAQNKMNVQQVQPRRLRVRDTAEAGVLITNLDTKEHKVNVSMAITEPRSKDEDSGFVLQKGEAFIDGKTEHSINIKSGENAIVYFDVAALKSGDISLEWTIKSDVLNERLIQNMTIEKTYIKEAFTTMGTLSSQSEKEPLIIPGFADDGEGDLTITLDATRLSLLEASVDYLFHYPYGCMEQRSAAILPLVIFGEYLDNFKLKNEVSNPKKVVENELIRWAKVQRPDGGFPYWPDGLESNDYVSTRIAYILSIAKEKKYKIPSSLDEKKLGNYVERQSRKTNMISDYTLAFMYYVLAYGGYSAPTSLMLENLIKQNQNDPCVLAYCGLTYQSLKKNSEAKAVAQKLKNLMLFTARGVDISERVNKQTYYDYYWGRPVEQLALALQLFVNIDGSKDLTTKLMYQLMQEKKAAGYWDSTASTVRVLAAVDALIKAENLEKLNVAANVNLDGKNIANGEFKGLNAKTVSKTLDFKTAPMAGMKRDTKLPLEFSKTGTKSGNNDIYWGASLRYAIPPELQIVRDEGIGLSLKITDVRTGSEVKDFDLQSGKLYKASVKVTSNRSRTYLALRVPVPSGAVIMDAAFVTTASEKPKKQNSIYPYNDYDSDYQSYDYNHRISNQAIYDNEVQYFWDSFGTGETTVEFVFNAARRGVYPTPPVNAECMYEPEIFGRTRGELWTIR